MRFGKNIMYSEVSYGKFSTVFMLKMNIVTSLIYLYISLILDFYFCLSMVEELTKFTVR